jgi:PIN like domain
MIFIDRSIPKSVAEALQKVRSDVEWLEPRFRHDATEAEWMQGAGEGGWLCITRDKKIRTRRGERQALIDNGVGCFLFVQKQNLTKWGYLKLLAISLDEMEERFAATERPFLYGVGRTGIFRRII